MQYGYSGRGLMNSLVLLFQTLLVTLVLTS